MPLGEEEDEQWGMAPVAREADGEGELRETEASRLKLSSRSTHE
jgi:hypothetical protein